MRLMVLIWVLHLAYLQAFQQQLGLVVPYDRMTLPEKVNVDILKLTLPDPLGTINPINEILGLISYVMNGHVFSSTHNAFLYPLNDLAQSINVTIDQISINNERLNRTSEKVDIGKSLEPKYRVAYGFDSLIPSSAFVEASYLMSELNKTKDYIPSPSDQADFRDTAKFARILYITSFLQKTLSLFNIKYMQFCDAIIGLRDGDIQKLKESFLQPFLEESIGQHFYVTDVPRFLKTSAYYEIDLEIATYEGSKELTKLKNVEYFGNRLSDTFYANEDKNEVYSLECIVDDIVCVPKSTPCTNALQNNSLATVMQNCEFEKHHTEYDILEERGIIINSPVKDEGLKRFLKENSLEVNSYPSLVTSDKCFTEENADITFCFKETKKVIPSKYEDDLLYSLLHPLFFSRIFQMVTDYALIVTVLIIIFSLLLTSKCMSCCKNYVKGMFRKHTRGVRRRDRERERERGREIDMK